MYPPETPDAWVPFQEIDFANKAYTQFHVDTRDFCCLASTEVCSKLPETAHIKQPKYRDSFFYTAAQVKALLHRYYAESGGKKEWRFFMLKGNENWQLKYIRIYRFHEGLLVCDKDNTAMAKHITGMPVKVDRYQ